MKTKKKPFPGFFRISLNTIQVSNHELPLPRSRSRWMTMYPKTWAQDVLRCHLCKTPGPPLYCDICHVHLCTFWGEHILDETKEHKVVPFKMNLLPYVLNISRKDVKFTANNEHCYLSLYSVCLLQNTKVIKFLT